MSPLLPLYLLLHLTLLPSPSTPCSSAEIDLSRLSAAFQSVRNFNLSHFSNCSSLTEIKLPACNLSGTVSWIHLRSITTLTSIDLSGNSLHGQIPSSFWGSPSLLYFNLSSNHLGGTIQPNSSGLRELDLSHNYFTGPIKLLGFRNLQLLNLSSNNLRSPPEGLGGLTKLQQLSLSHCNLTASIRGLLPNSTSLQHLDLSINHMTGAFPADFPSVNRLRFLNISFNRFSGTVPDRLYRHFGRSAFDQSGLQLPQTTHTPSNDAKNEKHSRRRSPSRGLVIGLAVGIAALAVTALAIGCSIRKARNSNKKGAAVDWSLDDEAEPNWVREVRARAAAAPVVMVEKPLLEMTFADLAAATSSFSRDSQLAEGGTTGAVYRAVLPGDMHVTVKHISTARTSVDRSALACLKHPNVLPLLGYCEAGEGDLMLVYEYMPNGDLHRWLHEPPLMSNSRRVDEWAHEETGSSAWAVRFGIALGVARGIAYLHHAAGGRAIVHGALDARSVLLGEDLEPRVYYTGPRGVVTAADDVWAYGMVLFELLSGEGGSREMVRWMRESVKESRGAAALDYRIRDGSDSEEGEMVEALRVGYLCTAEDPEKRPSMKQVVGLLKDIRSTEV